MHSLDALSTPALKTALCTHASNELLARQLGFYSMPAHSMLRLRMHPSDAHAHAPSGLDGLAGSKEPSHMP